ncbi:MAG: helix-turn-helix transcriptional regulator [Ruminococcus sp.]|nr:helix-turn-helix transcriptional regulator [Ruminococcus sp.]
MSEKLIGDKIREARKRAGLTQWQLADKIFVSESYIALIESNRRNPSTIVLSKIAEALNLTTDHILFESCSRTDDSFVREFENIISERSPEQIETAIKLLRNYFECLDDLKL